MSMHLCGPGLTTTSYKKRKQKVTKTQQEELERGWRERNVRLKQMGLSKESFEQYLEWVYGKGKKTKGQKNSGKKVTEAVTAAVTCKKEATDNKYSGNQETNLRSVQTPDNKMGNSAFSNDIPGHGRVWTTGACKTKQTPTYTGTKIIGIAVLHKSCLQPVFSQEEAIDVAHMRR